MKRTNDGDLLLEEITWKVHKLFSKRKNIKTNDDNLQIVSLKPSLEMVKSK